MNKKGVFLTVFLSILVGNIVAQPQYTVEHYTSENGLPQNSIKSISIDTYGFVWLATEDGLVRFDGHHFYVFNRSNLPISVNRIYFIEPAVRDKTSPGMGRNQISYATFEGSELVKIEKGTAVVDTNYRMARRRRLKSLEMTKGDRHIFEAKN